MAQSKYPISLKDASFPLLSELQPRTVIGNTVGKAPAQDERPGIAYCHNVIPTKEGVDTVGYLPQVDPIYPVPLAPFSDVRVVYATDMSRLYLTWSTSGYVYALLKGASSWITVSTEIISGFDINDVTIGTVNGVSYIFYAGRGCYTYDVSTNTLVEATLTGLDIPSVKGVIESAGYLVAYTELAIAWSSTIDPTDFVPSEVTGAGGGNVAGIAGNILFITSNSLGLLVYTEGNILAGTFTGNVQYPWKFRNVPNGKGGISLDLIAYEAESNDQYLFSKAGLQSVNSQRAEVILPEVTDFLAGKRFEDFNEVTKQYEITDITTTMKKKLKYVGSRYLIISYGISSFTHAIVVDTSFNRLGKLKIEHTDCFEYIDDQLEIAKETIAFLQADGAVSVVDFSKTADSSGVLILGKLQGSYTRKITLLGVEVENTTADDSLEVLSKTSLDGRNTTDYAGTLAYSNNEVREYVWRVTGENHSLVFIGKLNANTILVRYFLAGRR